MGTNELRWLHREIPDLVRRGVLTEEAAAALRRHYGEPPGAAGASRIALVVLSSLGAALVGGGVILLLAHNWEDLTRPVRAAISIGLLLAAQGIAAFALARRPASAPWREAAGGGVVLAAAASIALISQTYNLGGELPEFLRTVILLGLPVIYLLDSTLAAALIWIAMTIFVLDLGWRHVVPGWWYWIFAAAAVPYLVRLARNPARDWRLLAALVAIGLAVSMIAFGSWHANSATWMPGLAGLFAAYWAIGAVTGEGATARWRRSFQILGGIGLPALLVVLTFDGPWSSLRAITIGGPDPATGWVTLGIGVVAGALAAAAAVAHARAGRWHLALPAATILPVAACWATAPGLGPAFAQVLMNLWLVACGAASLVAGLRPVRLGTLNYGLLLLSAVALARFFDADISFLARGVGFIVIGLALFAVNALVLARRRGEVTP